MATRTRKAKPSCEELLAWLKFHLGREAIAALTGTDMKALAACVHLVTLYAYNGHQQVLDAFALAAMEMQDTTRELAYHAIAQQMDWPDRARIWARAGLPTPSPLHRCRGE